MSSSRRSRSVALIALALCGTAAMRHAGDARVRAPSAIAVVVTLDAGYQEQIGELGCQTRCADVTNALRDTLRHLLADHFGYAKWETGGAPADTIALQWLNPRPPYRYGEAHLAFVMRGASWHRQRDSIMEVFENSFDASDRMERPDGWVPSVVRKEWAPKIKALLSSQRVQESVFFRLALEATAPVGRTGEVRVFITSAALGAALDSNNAPQFDLRVSVKKDDPPDWEYPGDLRLSGCLVKSPYPGFADCTATSLRILNRPAYEGAELDALRATSTITTLRVHLARLQPPGAQPDTRAVFPP